MTNDMHNLRENYREGELNQTDLLTNPVEQFKLWFALARESNIKEPNAMTLSTSVNDVVYARIVLLKELRDEGFVFYTNYESNKGSQINNNNNVALTFLWKKLERQVRIQGIVEKITERESTKYFQGRPKGSQIGAWVSNQSGIITDRSVLERKKEELEEKYKDNDFLPRPDHWGGYLVKPKSIEFWQGRENRLHDRFSYSLKDGNKWHIDRLAP